MNKQKTIKGKISFEGIGLHTGTSGKVEILPAQAGTGINFIRRDITGFPVIKADVSALMEANKFPRRTSVGANGVYIHTIEHLMAAFNLLGVDNVLINVWGEEMPGLDGSAKPFVDEIQRVGLLEQEADRAVFSIKEPLWIDEDGANITVLPYPCLRVSYVMKYDHQFIGTGYADVEINNKLNTDAYQARTFCLEEEVKPLQAMGLGKGSNYKNTLVVGAKGVLENNTRISDEFVKHKVLDLIGDLYLVGPFNGHVIAVKSGHTLNVRLLEKLGKLRVSGGSSLSSDKELDIREIMKVLPHRPPFLLVDKVIYMEKDKRAVGIKNVTMNEYFFTGHFPGRPIMPGVLILEAMAQVAGVLMLSDAARRGKLAFFLTMDKVKFRDTVEPGDTLVMEIVVGKMRTKTANVTATATVNGKIVTEGEMMFAFTE